MPKKNKKKQNVLNQINIEIISYIIGSVGVAIIILGYTMIALDQNIDGIWAKSIAPITITIGFCVVAVAVIYKPKKITDV